MAVKINNKKRKRCSSVVRILLETKKTIAKMLLKVLTLMYLQNKTCNHISSSENMKNEIYLRVSCDLISTKISSEEVCLRYSAKKPFKKFHDISFMLGSIILTNFQAATFFLRVCLWIFLWILFSFFIEQAAPVSEEEPLVEWLIG